MPDRSAAFRDARRPSSKVVRWRARLLRADGSVADCRAVDSIAGGVGLVAQVPMRVNERVQVALQIPDEETGQLRVVVREGYVVASVLTSVGYRVGVKLADRLQELPAEIPCGP